MSLLAEAVGLVVDWFADRFTNRREREVWEHLPTGCCRCGTGGPDDKTGKPAVTRYLYSGVMAGKPADPSGSGDLDWAACSRHPLAHEEPILDYGNDIVVSWAQAHRDFEAAMEWRLRHG